MNQAQLLTDVLYFAANNDTQQWLIYYISRPLLGSFEPINIVPAIVPGAGGAAKPASSTQGPDRNMPRKKDIKSFSDLLNNFPMIARQMQPGLERLFKEFGKELGKPLPPPPSRTSSIGSRSESTRVLDDVASVHSKVSNGHAKSPFNSLGEFEDDEDIMRRALETAVTAAIDLFQLVDKQQLSLLGATTELTGPLVERLIERYVAEQVHDSLLFPRLCSYRRLDDTELDHNIRQMEYIDVSQVGIAIEGGRSGKEGIIRRLTNGVEEFRKMGVAGSPQEMLDILLATQKIVSTAATAGSETSSTSTSEKQASVLTINADVLVSLLLIVVIRSQVRHLQARLSYMQHFIYIDDVESGEMGYALSTYEAVLSYMMRDAGGLRRASMRNRRLWQATKAGKVGDIRAILEPDNAAVMDEDFVEEHELLLSPSRLTDAKGENQDFTRLNGSFHGHLQSEGSSREASNMNGSALAHVFPFQSWSNEAGKVQPRTGKKVSMDMRSLSGSSAVSFKSRTTTIGSTTSGIEGDTSIESLTKTQDTSGHSVPMMAIEARQPESLRYLLSLQEYYSVESILEDTNSEGTTLLSAAVQLAYIDIIDIILDFVLQAPEEQLIVSCLSKSDIRGRTVAHYLFNAPELMSRLGTRLPWRKKDKNGQTPLFALCRSYDHPNYNSMVNEALAAAQEAQGDSGPLRLDEHTDNRGNTLLHIVNDANIIHRILRHFDSDPNATNDKKFTPLMLASKYGRIDMVRVFFNDPRVDLHLKELRGLTAVELAKDDEVRNRIDDLTLFSTQNSGSTDCTGRITTVVRSFFVEDATVRFIIKSGAPNSTSDPNNTTYTITTCRRTLADFENLARWLELEHPASYLPTIHNSRSPFQIHSKPSRAVLHDTQTRLDKFLKMMLAHPTFATHEMLWEFFLVPEIQSEQMAERSKLKSQILAESIADDHEPVEDVRDVERFVAHARDMVRSVNAGTRSLIRRGHQLQHALTDVSEALVMCSAALSTLGAPTSILPNCYLDAFGRYVSHSTTTSDSSPMSSFITTVTSSHTTVLAMLASLTRPGTLITSLTTTQRALARNRSNLNSQSLPRRFNFPGLEESRMKSAKDTERKIVDGEKEVERLGKELRWTQGVVAGELAGWTAWREKVGAEAITTFVKGMVIKERERGKALERCLRALREAKGST